MRKKDESNRFGIPEKIKIGGHLYDVEMNDRFEDVDEDVNAQIMYEFSKIQIPVSTKSEKKRNIARVYKSLLHELCHGIDAVYTGGSIELSESYEETIEKIDTGWMQILSDNRLFLKEEYKIPKSVRIGGIEYKVDYPYRYNEVMDVACSFDYVTSIIKLSDSMNGILRSSSVIKVNFLSILFNVICINYKIDLGMDTLEEEKVIRTSFVNGLYQVLVDNDLEKLFYSR